MKKFGEKFMLLVTGSKCHYFLMQELNGIIFRFRIASLCNEWNSTKGLALASFNARKKKKNKKKIVTSSKLCKCLSAGQVHGTINKSFVLLRSPLFLDDKIHQKI